MTTNNFNELKEQMTLAPLQEFYAPKNINSKDAGLLATIAKSSVSSIESTIGTLTHLVQNLKIYKECMIDSINLQAESADIATQYSKEIPQQANTLPGVVATPALYDLNQIRSDNERMIQIKDQKDKVMAQKDIYMRMCSEDVRLFLSAWKRLNISNASFDEFVESLNKAINPSY